MPLVKQNRIGENTHFVIWKIEEPIDFFILKAPIYRAIHHPYKRLQHIVGRYLLYFLDNHFPFEKIVYHPANNAPYIADSSMFFSISHSQNYVAAMVGKKQLAIDIETNFEQPVCIKEKFIHPSESQWLKGLETNLDKKIYQYIWCIKEAVYKFYAPVFLEFKNHINVDKFTVEKNSIIDITVKIDIPSRAFFEEKKGQFYTSDAYSCASITDINY